MTEFKRYIVEEHIEDFNDGLIPRRELLRRVTLITGSATASVALLSAMGCSTTEPSGTAAPTPTTRATSTAAEFATPPPSPVPDGMTVRENDPRIVVAPLAVNGPDGAPLISYHARPASSAAGGILVVHENRGLTPHIKDVVRRVATAGFNGLSVDLLSRDGGADTLTDPAAYSAALAKRSADDMVLDVRAAVNALSGTGVGDKIGITGFCFGGGMVWNSVAAKVPLKAAVPFYGPAPREVERLMTATTPVLAVYAEKDSRITSTRDAVESALKQSGQPYKMNVYPGVDHAFHNDTGARYDARQAEAAWIAAIDWFRQYIKG